MTGGISDGTPPTGPTGAAIEFVGQGWNYFEQKATDFSNRALNLITGLQYVPQVQPVSFNVTFPDISGLTAFVAPPAPELAAITFREVPMPSAPELAIAPGEAFVSAPEFDVAPPTAIALPNQPGDFTVAAPGDAPELTVLVLPDAPQITMPELPELLTITLPDIPTISMPTFNGRDPGDVPALPDLSDVGFTEKAYTREVLNDIIPQVRRALAGDSLLAASVEQALFARARERNRTLVRKARQEAAEDVVSRGFTEPTGSYLARVADIRTEALASENEINRDLSIEFHQQAIQQAQFAVTQGIALEQVLIGQHAAMMDRSLQASKLMLDAHVALHNAAVASYNASIERLRVDADVFGKLIDAEIGKLEAYKAQVDGQRAVADVNKAAADAYDSRVRGLLGIVEVYKANIDAVRAQAEIESTKIEAHKSSVQAYAEQARAYSARWEGFGRAVEAQQSDFRRYEIGVNAFNARIQGWGRGEEIKVARRDADLRGETLRLDRYRAQVQGALGMLQAEDSRVRALVSQNQSIAAMYTATAQVEGVRNDSNTRAFEAATAYHTARTNAELQQAQIKIQDAARLLTAQVEAIRGAANAMAQLAASAMSAVNFSAGVSGSGSESQNFSLGFSKGVSWNYSGEVPDGSGPTF